MLFINCPTMSFATLCLFSFAMGNEGKGDEVGTRLVVLSLYGLHEKMIDDQKTPNLAKFRNECVSAPLRATYSVTYVSPFNNHFCIATGICPAERGKFDTTVNDIMQQEAYDRNLTSDIVVPIWTQHERAGNGRLSGVFMWPTSELQYRTEEPTHYIEINKGSVGKYSFDEFLTWINDDKKPNLLMAYIQLRTLAYESEVEYAQQMDSLFGKIFKELETAELLEKKVNLIVLTCTNFNFGNVFIASGPMFKKNTKISESISISEVYPLLKHLLNIHEEASEIQSTIEMNEMKNVLLVSEPGTSEEAQTKITKYVEDKNENQFSHFYYSNR